MVSVILYLSLCIHLTLTAAEPWGYCLSWTTAGQPQGIAPTRRPKFAIQHSMKKALVCGLVVPFDRLRTGLVKKLKREGRKRSDMLGSGSIHVRGQ